MTLQYLLMFDSVALKWGFRKVAGITGKASETRETQFNFSRRNSCILDHSDIPGVLHANRL